MKEHKIVAECSNCKNIFTYYERDIKYSHKKLYIECPFCKSNNDTNLLDIYNKIYFYIIKDRFKGTKNIEGAVNFSDHGAICIVKKIYDCYFDDKTKQIIYLKIIGGKTYSEISEQLETNANYLGQKFRAAIRQFNYALTKYYNGDTDNADDSLHYLKASDFIYKATFNCLKRAGYTTDESLKDITYHNFISIRGAGYVYWHDCMQYMDKHNITYEDFKYDAEEAKERLHKCVYSLLNKYKLTTNMNHSDIVIIDINVEKLNAIIKEIFTRVYEEV